MDCLPPLGAESDAESQRSGTSLSLALRAKPRMDRHVIVICPFLLFPPFFSTTTHLLRINRNSFPLQERHLPRRPLVRRHIPAPPTPPDRQRRQSPPSRHPLHPFHTRRAPWLRRRANNRQARQGTAHLPRHHRLLYPSRRLLPPLHPLAI